MFFQVENETDQTVQMHRLDLILYCTHMPTCILLFYLLKVVGEVPQQSLKKLSWYQKQVCGNGGSYMSAHVLLNLLHELRKRDKMQGLPSILSFSQRV